MIIRKLLIGLILGGGFGAKLGAYLSTIITLSTPMNMIEIGFINGSLIGMGTSLIILMPKILGLIEVFFQKYSIKSLRTSA